jgi:heme O synthase-like polyprenyltransferase
MLNCGIVKLLKAKAAFAVKQFHILTIPLVIILILLAEGGYLYASALPSSGPEVFNWNTVIMLTLAAGGGSALTAIIAPAVRKLKARDCADCVPIKEIQRKLDEEITHRLGAVSKVVFRIAIKTNIEVDDIEGLIK